MLKKVMLTVAAATVMVGLGTMLLGLWPHRAEAAPEVGVGAISLSLINDTQTIYSCDDPFMVGVTVKVTAGELVVEYLDGGTWTPLGTLAANRATVFEGPYTQVRVKATISATAGTYSNRRPTDQHDTSHIIGTATVTLSGSAVRVFRIANLTNRHIFVASGGSAAVSVRASSGGANITSFDAGDAGYCSDKVTEFWITGSGTVTFTILDQFMVVVGDTKKTGTATRNTSADEDEIFHGNGDQCFKVHIKNTGTAPAVIKAKYKANANPEADITVDPNDEIDVTCKLEYVRVAWTGTAAGEVTHTTEAATNPD